MIIAALVKGTDRVIEAHSWESMAEFHELYRWIKSRLDADKISYDLVVRDPDAKKVQVSR